MALERSVLTDAIISDLLMKNYGISVVSVQMLKLGTANCYRISDGDRYYFLKEFQSSFSEIKIIQEANLLNFLTTTDIPTTHFYKTVDNKFVIHYQNHIICVEEYVEGQAYGYDDFPPKLLPQVGRMLGKLHASLKDYSLPLDLSGKWLASFSAGNMTAQYDTLIDIAKNKSHDRNVVRIMDDLEYKKELAIRCEEYIKYYRGVTYCSIHGDYQGCQLIFNGEEVKAVIDFSSACTLPVTWEIMRSFVQSSKQCRDSASVDVDAFCSYVREYIKFFNLTKTDMISMPYVYLFQLARSKYGYPQYLNSDSPDKEGLLQFAFWRTQICREVERKAETISNELLKLM